MIHRGAFHYHMGKLIYQGSLILVSFLWSLNPSVVKAGLISVKKNLVPFPTSFSLLLSGETWLLFFILLQSLLNHSEHICALYLHCIVCVLYCLASHVCLCLLLSLLKCADVSSAWEWAYYKRGLNLHQSLCPWRQLLWASMVLNKLSFFLIIWMHVFVTSPCCEFCKR